MFKKKKEKVIEAQKKEKIAAVYPQVDLVDLKSHPRKESAVNFEKGGSFYTDVDKKGKALRVPLLELDPRPDQPTIRTLVLQANRKLAIPLVGMKLVRCIRHYVKLAYADSAITCMDYKKTRKGAWHKVRPAGTKLDRSVALV